jgi:phage shock protein PspC (stress-responsive transcriptional regulator)
MERMSSIWTIRRSATDSKLAGLCGGVAQHWGIDPVLVRVGWVLLALSGGIGLVLYLAGWLLIPVEGNEKAPIDDLFGESVRRWPRELWITLVVVLCLAMFAIFGWWLSPFGVGPAIVIAVIWYFGFYKGRHDRGAGVAPGSSTESLTQSAEPTQPQFVRYPGPPTAFTEAAEAWQRRIEEHTRQVGTAGQTRAMPPGQWPHPPAGNLPEMVSEHLHPSTSSGRNFPAESEPVEHTAFLAEPDPVGLYVEPPTAAPVKMSDTRSAKRLRLISLIALGLTLSGLGMAQALGAAIPLAGYLAAALLVIALTLVAATWLGMARGLLPLGILLAVAVVIITAAGPALRVPVATTSTHTYSTIAELPAGDTEDYGDLSIDLSQLPVTRDATYAAHVDLGRLEVTVPKDANVLINYTADLGAVRAYGADVKAGSDLDGRITDPQPARPGQHTLTLELSVDAGNIEVRR